MALTKRKALLLTLSSAAVAATITAPAQAQPQPQARAGAASAVPALSWKACADSPGAECADLSVPLDYRKPGGRHITVAVSRLRTDRPQARRGTLLVIAGGPGSSGRAKVATMGAELREATRGAYDIVGLDPRGVGGSTRADCKLDDDDREITHFRSYPAPDGDISANVVRSRRIAESCAVNGGELVRSFSTANEVRDIDRLREALGEEKLSAWGSSYGTYVGAVYAQKYPQRTDRWVLDSNGDPDPSRVERGWLANMSAAADDRFPDFAKWAADPSRDAKHRVAERPEDVRPAVLALASKLDRLPEQRNGKPLLTGNRLRAQLQQALYYDRSFEKLAATIVAARDAGDDAPPVAEPLIVPAADAPVTMAVICNDVQWPRSIASYERAVAADRVRHPLTAGMPVNVTPCAFWKYAPADKPTRITPDGGPSNVLMVQNLRDPATPYRGALKMREAFGDRARMVSVDTGGHGAYLSATKSSATACADRTVSEFFVTGRRPDGDVLCR
ncbi:alpha/beta hydrolase [Streptomyces sp. SCA3-4]|uniref:alpha/beta hydrolase n=1 Tax=Streptomyces sichuanensis TaxID=2871810 RepID=UPI001CE30A27|nr:alpha/beta hydrolase [Streptomyces sichuanensis]MCA6093028.1 alpha/beta hydrolase [Streptomyces sichuanensis]